jgi:hypothetical protein
MGAAGSSSSSAIVDTVDLHLGHRKGKFKAAKEFFSVKQNLRDVWRELDVDKNKSVTLYEIRLFVEQKIDLGLLPWRYLGGISEKTMRAAFRKTQDMLDMTHKQVPKRGFTTLMKNVWFFSSFWDIFDHSDLNQDSKIDRLEFGFMVETYGLQCDKHEYDRALALTQSDEKFGLGFFAFCEYCLYIVRGRRKKDASGFYIVDYARNNEIHTLTATRHEEEGGEDEDEDEDENEEDAEVSGVVVDDEEPE